MKSMAWTRMPALGGVVVLGVLGARGVDREDTPRVEEPVALETVDPRSAALAAQDTMFEKVVVLGIDGMDPDILAEVIERFPERTKNFQRLIAEGGGPHNLGTSIPPQSPVAWSNFITGLDPGGHGIFDFIHRDPVNRAPAPSTTRSEPVRNVPLFSGWQFPMGGDSESNRSGVSFWEVLANQGVPADLWRMPINFPVESAKGLSFPGMMTPALDSAYGEFTLYTSDPPADMRVPNGKLEVLEFFGDVASTRLRGPENPFKAPDEETHQKEHGLCPMSVMLNREINAAVIEVGSDIVILEPGQWSDFVTASFEILPMGMMNMDGKVRFFLKTLTPELVEIYASPINIDPTNPATPVSEPQSAAADLADRRTGIGPYYTQGMAEDVNALKAEVLTPPQFMAQSQLVYDERRAMMDYAIDHYIEDGEGGLFFFYYSTVDLTNHMMWDLFDAEHPHHDAELAAQDSSDWSGRPGSTWGEAVYDAYLRMDPVLGHLRERMGDDITLIVMSDHGFAPFRRKFSLNTWLLENGYLHLHPEASREEPKGAPGHKDVFLHGKFEAGNGEIVDTVDWENTIAYGMGFNGLYLNLKGREGCDADGNPVEGAGQGSVDPSDADAILRKLKLELEAIRDPENNNKQVVYVADIATDVYTGPRMAEAPDIQVGYNTDYQNSDESSTGRIPHAVFGFNEGGTFVGSHLMASEVVPGTLLSNKPLRDGTYKLEDVTVEILKRYGIQPVGGMSGQPFLK